MQLRHTGDQLQDEPRDLALDVQQRALETELAQSGQHGDDRGNEHQAGGHQREPRAVVEQQCEAEDREQTAEQ